MLQFTLQASRRCCDLCLTISVRPLHFPYFHFISFSGTTNVVVVSTTSTKQQQKTTQRLRLQFHWKLRSYDVEQPSLLFSLFLTPSVLSSGSHSADRSLLKLHSYSRDLSRIFTRYQSSENRTQAPATVRTRHPPQAQEGPPLTGSILLHRPGPAACPTDPPALGKCASKNKQGGGSESPGTLTTALLLPAGQRSWSRPPILIRGAGVRPQEVSSGIILLSAAGAEAGRRPGSVSQQTWSHAASACSQPGFKEVKPAAPHVPGLIQHHQTEHLEAVCHVLL